MGRHASIVGETVRSIATGEYGVVVARGDNGRWLVEAAAGTFVATRFGLEVVGE